MPAGGLARRIKGALARVRLRVGGDVDQFLDAALRGEVGPEEVARALSGLRECPGDPAAAASKLLRLGLPEVVVSLAERGCAVGSGNLAAARAQLLGLGDAAGEARAARLLGDRPRLAPGSAVVVAYCGAVVEVMVDGLASRVPPREALWRGVDPREALARIVAAASPRLVLKWGSCALEGALDARLLAAVAFPEVANRLHSLAHALGISTSHPITSIVLRVALESARALAGAGVDLSRLPGLGAASELLELGDRLERMAAPAEPHGRPDAIVLTDRPRATAPVWRPLRIAKDPQAVGADPLALAAFKSLAHRRGDAVRALAASRGLPFGEQLSRLISSSLSKSGSGPAPGDQVLPEDAGHVPEGSRVVADCLRPLASCLGALAGRAAVEAATYVPEGLAALLGVRAPSRGSVRAYHGDLGPGPRGLSEAVGAALAALSGSARGLLVVPSSELADAIASSLGLARPVGEAGEAWLAAGGVGVVSWEEAAGEPEVVSAASAVALLFPERFEDVRRVEGVSAAVDSIVQLAASLGAYVVSRALRPGERRDVEPYVPGGAGAAKVGLSAGAVMGAAERAFEELWRGHELRPYQRLALEVLSQMVASGEPTAEVVILPTGAGKSAIFQVAARALGDLGLGSAALVISPLRALIHDQVRGASGRGLRASYIDSTVPAGRRAEAVEAASRGLLDLLYLTPEGFQYMPEVASLSPSLIVLDEAHSVSRWGLSFRPSYLSAVNQVNKLRSSGWPPVLALTASAPRDVVRDLLAALNYDPDSFDERRILLQTAAAERVEYRGRPVVLRAPALRPEIAVDVVPARDGPERVEDLVEAVRRASSWADSLGDPWVGVVFVPFVRSSSQPWLNAESVAARLREELGVRVLYYHGQMGDARRRAAEAAIARAVERGERVVVVATKAFGMGVDIPNIRWTVHVMPSESVEDLYQEIGRAGRDGRRALSLVLYNPSDLDVRRRMIAAEAVRPSGLLKFANLLASAAEAVKDWRLLALPLSASGGMAKYLDVLRIAGALDYDVVRGPLFVYAEGRRAVEEAAGWCVEVRGGGCVAPRAEGLEPLGVAHLNVCGGEASYSPGPAQGCESMPLEGLVALVTPFSRPRRARHLDPELFGLSFWLYRRELERLSELGRLLDEVAAARSRGGPAEASARFAELVDAALNSSAARPPAEFPRLGRIHEVEDLGECVEGAARAAVEIENRVGEGSATLAAQPSLEAAVLSAYVRLAGRAPARPPRAAYRGVLRLLRSGDLAALHDYGYVVLVARRSKVVNEALRAARGYPYLEAFLCARGVRAARRA